MNVLGVGPLELIVIMLVALIFVGPERLPRLAADLARTIRELRKYTNSLAAEFNEVVQEIERETTADRAEWKEIGQGLSEAVKSVSDEVAGAQSDAAGSSAQPSTTNAPTHAQSRESSSINGVSPGDTPAAAAESTPLESPR
jgi:sec-independent protein translocase protein TatB